MPLCCGAGPPSCIVLTWTPFPDRPCPIPLPTLLLLTAELDRKVPTAKETAGFSSFYCMPFSCFFFSEEDIVSPVSRLWLTPALPFLVGVLSSRSFEFFGLETGNANELQTLRPGDWLIAALKLLTLSANFLAGTSYGYDRIGA